eukprot:4317663-Prymnesium_polylepis.1
MSYGDTRHCTHDDDSADIEKSDLSNQLKKLSVTVCALSEVYSTGPKGAHGALQGLGVDAEALKRGSESSHPSASTQ